MNHGQNCWNSQSTEKEGNVFLQWGAVHSKDYILARVSKYISEVYCHQVKKIGKEEDENKVWLEDRQTHQTAGNEEQENIV